MKLFELFKKKEDNTNISEPVISFVNTVLEQPKRFRWYSDFSNIHVVYDSQLKLKYTYSYDIIYVMCNGWLKILTDVHCNDREIDFLTFEERVYLYKYLAPVVASHIARLKLIKQTRAQRQRKDFIKLYCKENTSV